MKIKRADYERYETCILSDQTQASEVHALMRDNPHFKEWYLERAHAREVLGAVPARAS